MKIVMVHGQNHVGSTCQIGRQLAEKLGGEALEFFLPRDFGDFCVGCSQCFMKGEENCPHYHKLEKITEAMDQADVLIFTSPVYVYHVTGPMKSFLDHYGYRWMVHRPVESMFQKQAVCISTAAGAGMKSTNKDMADSFFFWGIPKIYTYGKAVATTNWASISEKKRSEIDAATTKLANKIRKHHGKVKPGIKTKAFFMMMRMVQRKWGWCDTDVAYWNEKGWTKDKRPWR